jgi:hypothetical protein
MEQRPSTPPESPGGEARWGERRERRRSPEEELADLYADLGGKSRAQGDAPPPPPRSGPDFSAFFVLLDVLRRAAPSDIQDRFTSLIREALLTLRSLIDWYLDRLDHPAREPHVEDIPIE